MNTVVTQYTVRWADGVIGPISSNLGDALQDLEGARELEILNPDLSGPELVCRTITTVRSEWEPVDLEPEPEPEPSVAEVVEQKARARGRRKAS